MAYPISEGSRWRTRPQVFQPSGQMSPDGKWNLLLYLAEVTDNDFVAAANSHLTQGPILEICQDLDSQSQPTQLRGNAAAGQLMFDFDSAISLGHQLVNNFEIEEPLGVSTDMNWVGDGLDQTYGFPNLRLKQAFQWSLRLGILGWRVRNKFNPHLGAAGLAFGGRQTQLKDFPAFLPERPNSLPDFGPEVELVVPGNIPDPAPGEPGGPVKKKIMEAEEAEEEEEEGEEGEGGEGGEEDVAGEEGRVGEEGEEGPQDTLEEAEAEEIKEEGAEGAEVEEAGGVGSKEEDPRQGTKQVS
ncbi:hypothetical protein F4859DRAFT_528936 [Xylaria cf. heliscus]|nr:hypothetical protein F4859DRAFT_528936 [Xylaria cf. heliscus]